MGFTLKAAWLATLVAATHPLAVAAHVSLEALFGDSLLLEEWLNGSRRTAACAVIDGSITGSTADLPRALQGTQQFATQARELI